MFELQSTSSSFKEGLNNGSYKHKYTPNKHDKWPGHTIYDAEAQLTMSWQILCAQARLKQVFKWSCGGACCSWWSAMDRGFCTQEHYCLKIIDHYQTTGSGQPPNETDHPSSDSHHEGQQPALEIITKKNSFALWLSTRIYSFIPNSIHIFLQYPCQVHLYWHGNQL